MERVLKKGKRGISQREKNNGSAASRSKDSRAQQYVARILGKFPGLGKSDSSGDETENSSSPKSGNGVAASRRKLYARIQSGSQENEVNTLAPKEKLSTQHVSATLLPSSAEQEYARIDSLSDKIQKSIVQDARQFSKDLKGKGAVLQSDSDPPASSFEKDFVLSDFSKRKRESMKKNQGNIRRQLHLDEDIQNMDSTKRRRSSPIALSSDSDSSNDRNTLTREEIAVELSPIRTFLPTGRRIPQNPVEDSPGCVPNFVLSPKSYRPSTRMGPPARADLPLSPVENLRRRLNFTESVADTDDVGHFTFTYPWRNCLKLISSQAVYNYRQDYLRHESKLRNVVLSWGLPVQGSVKIPRRNGFAVCEVCSELKARHDNAVLAEKKAIASRALMIHREQQMQERVKLSKHRRKCLVNSSKYLGIVIDGMDQKKTAIPHWPNPPKNVDKDNQIKVHVVGALLFNGTVQSRAFLMFGNIKANVNLTVTVIHKIISDWDGALPDVLYLQLDNTTRENKNSVLLGYLNLLVQKGIFQKVKIGFLLVGHTHDQIDQMFSRFSVRLRREKCFTLPSLVETIEAAYKPKPKVTVLKESWDFTEWFRSPTKLLESLHGITFNQQFRIEKVNAEAKMWAKQFSTDEFWLPSEGIKHLKAEPEADRNILSSEQHPLKAYSEMKKSSLEGRDLDPVKSVESIHLNLQSTCHKYFNALDIEWWENFFLEQLDLGAHIKNGSRAPLMEVLQFPGARPIPASSSAIEPDEAQASRLVPVELEETRDEVFGSRREIYTGAHRPEPGSVAHAKKHHLGDLNELKVSSLIAVVC
ncbi:hypothetical protein R1sor_010795 [Riccia sorocarpa]|uniref:DUF7869 domain-containing protein n=1 Tax=Riccia sorocarpa TaxID=122646 RepID=A0ABD3I2H8_9MARC